MKHDAWFPLSAAVIPLLAVMICLMPRATSATSTTSVSADITFEGTAPYYQPQLAVVEAGTPIRWINTTASPHTVRHDGCLTGEVCAFESIAVPPDSSFLIAPLPPGRYAYHCELHPIMRGTVVVTEPGEQGATALTAGQSRK